MILFKSLSSGLSSLVLVVVVVLSPLLLVLPPNFSYSFFPKLLRDRNFLKSFNHSSYVCVLIYLIKSLFDLIPLLFKNRAVLGPIPLILYNSFFLILLFKPWRSKLTFWWLVPKVSPNETTKKLATTTHRIRNFIFWYYAILYRSAFATKTSYMRCL